MQKPSKHRESWCLRITPRLVLRWPVLLSVILSLCAASFPFLNRSAIDSHSSATPLLRFLKSAREITFAERVACQQAVESVYWKHRIWPVENPGPKPALEEIIPPAQIEEKVQAYLHNSQLVANERPELLGVAQLQAEMDRMASHTRQPEMLRELFSALDDDPFLVAECLAKPILADRLVADLHSGEDTVHSESRALERKEIWPLNAPEQSEYQLPSISLGPASGCTDDTWSVTNTNAPSARTQHTAVWTGSEMIIWGGTGLSVANTGGRSQHRQLDCDHHG